MDNLDELRNLVNEEAASLADNVIGWKEKLLARIEDAKNDQILTEMRKLNDRMAKLEARLPDQELEVD